MKKNTIITITTSILVMITAFGAWQYYKKINNQPPSVYSEKLEPVKINFHPNGAFVYVWSSVCGSCIQNLAYVGILSQKLQERKIPLYLVLTQDNPSLYNYANAHLVRYQMPSHIKTLIDKNQDFTKFYKINETPTMLIFNKKGELVDKKVGTIEWNNLEVFNEAIEKL